MICDIIFDLDGTLTDSGPGILNCVQPALARFGLHPPRESLGYFVGPPLGESFVRAGVPADKADEAIAIFRARYHTVGKFENSPYPGIPELLARLSADGFRLHVGTSKPELTANEVLAHFDLTRWFTHIRGATMDHSRETKAQVLAALLAEVEGPAVMVGDTAYDVRGAKAHGLDTVGVAWGYGTVADMEGAGAIAIAHDPAELETILRRL